MQEAIDAYRSVTASAEFRELERLRSKARHDEAQALYDAEQKGIKEEREKWQEVVAVKEVELSEKEAKLSEKDAKLSEKEAELSEKDALIAELMKRLGENK